MSRLDARVFTEKGECPACNAACMTCGMKTVVFESLRVHANGAFRVYHACQACGESTMAREPRPEVIQAHGVVVRGATKRDAP